MILVGTTFEVLPVIEIDSQPIRAGTPGPVAANGEAVSSGGGALAGRDAAVRVGEWLYSSRLVGRQSSIDGWDGDLGLAEGGVGRPAPDDGRDAAVRVGEWFCGRATGRHSAGVGMTTSEELDDTSLAHFNRDPLPDGRGHSRSSCSRNRSNVELPQASSPRWSRKGSRSSACGRKRVVAVESPAWRELSHAVSKGLLPLVLVTTALEPWPPNTWIPCSRPSTRAITSSAGALPASRDRSSKNFVDAACSGA